MNLEPTKILNDLTIEFDKFKNRNEGRVDKMDGRLRDIEAAMDRPNFPFGGDGSPGIDPEVLKGFNDYLRFDIRSAMKVGDDPAGGYFVPPHRSDSITTRIFESSPIRQLSRVETITEDAFEEPLDWDEAAASWVGETETRGETDTPDVSMFRVPLHEVQAEPHTTQKLLDTASYNVEGWLEGKIANKFSRAEAAAFVNGDGVKQPRGLLTYPTSTDADSARAYGTLEYTPTGANGAFAGSNPADALIDCTYSLKAEYRQGAVWLMGRRTAAAVRKMKDGDGTYLWQPAATAGQPHTFVGFPVTLGEDMPEIATGSFSMAFGNFQRGYIVVDHADMRILRDPFTKKGWVKFYTTKRVGGAVYDSEAIKLVKFATS